MDVSPGSEIVLRLDKILSDLRSAFDQLDMLSSELGMALRSVWQDLKEVQSKVQPAPSIPSSTYQPGLALPRIVGSITVDGHPWAIDARRVSEIRRKHRGDRNMTLIVLDGGQREIFVEEDYNEVLKMITEALSV